MNQLGNIRRRIGGLMVALFAVLFVAGPMLDGVLCAADGVAPAETSAQAPLAAEAVQKAVQPRSAEPIGLCQHGHSHITGVCAHPADHGRRLATALADRPFGARDGPPAFRLAFGLDRPPRV